MIGIVFGLNYWNIYVCYMWVFDLFKLWVRIFGLVRVYVIYC